MEVSKAFRAKFQLGDEQTLRLQRWAATNFALSSIFRSARSTVLVGLTDRTRTAASFARKLRTAMQRMALPTDKRTLRGHWVTLLSASEAVTLCTVASDDVVAAMPASNAPKPNQAATAPSDSEVRLIPLP